MRRESFNMNPSISLANVAATHMQQACSESLELSKPPEGLIRKPDYPTLLHVEEEVN